MPLLKKTLNNVNEINNDLTLNGKVQCNNILQCPRLTTAERDLQTPANGYMIYNTTLNTFEVYENGSWVDMGTGADLSNYVTLNTEQNITSRKTFKDGLRVDEEDIYYLRSAFTADGHGFQFKQSFSPNNECIRVIGVNPSGGFKQEYCWGYYTGSVKTNAWNEKARLDYDTTNTDLVISDKIRLRNTNILEFHQGANKWEINYDNASNDLDFKYNNTTYIKLDDTQDIFLGNTINIRDSSNLVGISTGAFTPTSLLHLNDANPTLTIQSSGGLGQILFNSTNSSQVDLGFSTNLYHQTGGNFKIRNTSTDALELDSNQRFGLSGASPQTNVSLNIGTGSDNTGILRLPLITTANQRPDSSGFNGGMWYNSDTNQFIIMENGVKVALHHTGTTSINANQIHDASVSNTEYGYLNGVTSNIQTQLDSKAADVDTVKLSGAQTITGKKNINEDLRINGILRKALFLRADAFADSQNIVHAIEFVDASVLAGEECIRVPMTITPSNVQKFCFGAYTGNDRTNTWNNYIEFAFNTSGGASPRISINNNEVLNETTLGSTVVSSSLTSVGTLTSLDIDNININGNTISRSGGSNLILDGAGGGNNIHIAAGTSLDLLGGDLLFSGTSFGVATITLENKSLKDSNTFFIDDGDATKKAQFQCSNITTGTTRTYTCPNANGTLVLTGNTQTLSNKSFNDEVDFTQGLKITTNNDYRFLSNVGSLDIRDETNTLDIMGLSNTEINANVDINIASTKVLKVADTQVITSQQAAISNPASTTGANNAAIISILGALRTHGLIAT